MEWQPIETAPKDGTRIMVFLKSQWETQPYHIVEAAWGCKSDGDYRNLKFKYDQLLQDHLRIVERLEKEAQLTQDLIDKISELAGFALRNVSRESKNLENEKIY